MSEQKEGSERVLKHYLITLVTKNKIETIHSVYKDLHLSKNLKIRVGRGIGFRGGILCKGL